MITQFNTIKKSAFHGGGNEETNPSLFSPTWLVAKIRKQKTTLAHKISKL